MKMIYNSRIWFVTILCCLASVLPGCKKLVDVKPPVTSLVQSDVYSNDQSATSVLTGVYSSISVSAFGSGQLNSMSLLAGLSADELSLYSAVQSPAFIGYYTNALTSSNTANADFWTSIYPVVFTVNSAIAGLSQNQGLTPAVQQQLMGEARFMRAFCYFYLVNLYGDVPLVTGVDYTVNAKLARTPQSQVWQQIIQDLKSAQQLLSPNYLDGSLLNQSMARLRPTSWAATAMLARSYLYMQEWDSAVAQATTVINNSALYNLDTLNGVFLNTSMEGIWELQPVIAGQNTPDAWMFIIPATGPDPYSWPVYLQDSLLNTFETNDQRRVDWIDSVNVSGTTYYYPYKYKSATLDAPFTEYEVVLRLGELFLIRAEANAQEGNLAEASSDLNTIRARAGLGPSNATTQSSLSTAILHERQVELFTEWGHRWLDLKRTNAVDSVMQVVTPQKGGGTWTENAKWYPIPLGDIQSDPNLVQNKGY